MEFLLRHKIKIAIILVIILGYFGYNQFLAPKKATTTYQTGTVEKGTLINSISATGSITSGDTTYITTGATGTVSKVYVKNGDTVKADAIGETIKGLNTALTNAQNQLNEYTTL